MDWESYAAVLHAGGVLACPTETLFGLLADAHDKDAVARVIALKGRGDGSPIGLLAPDLASVLGLAKLSTAARALAEKHWPGPLSLVLRVRDTELAPGLTRDGTVSVRVPGESPALHIVRAFGDVVTATSCNPSGKPAAQTAEEARAYFQKLSVVPGKAGGTLPSTIIDATGPELKVLRQGAIQL